MLESSFRTMLVLLGPESKGRNFIRIIYEKIKKEIGSSWLAKKNERVMQKMKKKL